MTKLEKVIKGLDICSSKGWCEGDSECPYWTEKEWKFDDCKQLLKDARELLKEQEPIKPTVNVDTWVCSKCGHALERQELIGDNAVLNEQYDFCPGCGKKVKWE